MQEELILKKLDNIENLIKELIRINLIETSEDDTLKFMYNGNFVCSENDINEKIKETIGYKAFLDTSKINGYNVEVKFDNLDSILEEIKNFNERFI